LLCSVRYDMRAMQEKAREMQNADTLADLVTRLGLTVVADRGSRAAVTPTSKGGGEGDVRADQER